MKKRLTLLLSAIGSLALLLNGIAQVPDNSTTAIFEGVVVRAGTSEPIPGALVELGSNASRITYVVESGSDGRFQFRNIPPGSYRVQASHYGYLRLYYAPRTIQGIMMPVNLDPGRRMDNVQLPLVPAAVISGRVIDQYGDPMVAHVLLYKPLYTDGRNEMTQVQDVVSDDLGNFRIFALPPGRYYVGLRYPLSGSASTLYFPNSADLRNAQAIELTAGKIVGNINLAAQTEGLRHIRGRFSGENGNADVRLTAMTSLQSSAPQTVFPDSNTGEFDISGVAPGLYALTATSGSLFGKTMVDVRNKDIEGADIAIRPGIEIPVHVLLDPETTRSNAVDISDLSFAVRPFPPVARVADSVFAPETGASFSILASPGDYRIFKRPIPKDAYIKSIRLGSTDVLNDGLLVDSGMAGTVEIVIGSNPGKLHGVVTNTRRQASAFTFLVLAPESSSRQHNELFKSVYTDDAGHFDLENIAPGNYSVFAWEDFEPSEWQDPEFLRRYENRATTVHIEPGSSPNIQVTAIPSDQ